MPKTRSKKTRNEKPPQHHTEAEAKCPPPVTADIEKSAKTDFINSIDPKPTYGR